jgi:peptidoglycan/xylan/chitin deacetylase (PgdA/CDA1 family)
VDALCGLRAALKTSIRSPPMQRRRPWYRRTVVPRARALPLAAIALLACAARPAPAPPSVTAPQPTASAAPHSASSPVDVAITVDDLPDHGPEVPGQSRLAIHQAFLAAFRAHHVPAVYGFVVGGALDKHPGDRAALEAWIAAGNLLGNHTRTHPDIHKTSVDAYLADLDANEALLKSLSRDDRAWHVFRYPYLQEGNDLPSRARIREHLAQRGYRIAQVTIDFYDWAYNEPYARCLAKRDTRAIDALKQSYLDDAAVFLHWSDEAARALTGRPVAQILLLHIGAFDALVIDELLARYEREGARFVSLDDAMADPIYTEEPKDPKGWEGTFLQQVREARGVTSPVEPALPEGLLDALCR